MLAGAGKLAHADQPQDSHCLLKPADKKADVVGVSLSGSESQGPTQLQRQGREREEELHAASIPRIT